MPDTKLTDLETITEPDIGDILYIVDVDKDASKQITFGNLVQTRLDTLSTDFIALSTSVEGEAQANATDIVTLQNETININTNILTLSTDRNALSADVLTLSADVVGLKGIALSTIDTGKFSFGTAMTVSSASPNTQHITTFNTELGDFGLVSLSALGGLSGLETNFYPMSTNKFELMITTRTNDDRSITIPANTVFTYFVNRNIIND